MELGHWVDGTHLFQEKRSSRRRRETTRLRGRPSDGDRGGRMGCREERETGTRVAEKERYQWEEKEALNN